MAACPEMVPEVKAVMAGLKAGVSSNVSFAGCLQVANVNTIAMAARMLRVWGMWGFIVGMIWNWLLG